MVIQLGIAVIEVLLERIVEFGFAAAVQQTVQNLRGGIDRNGRLHQRHDRLQIKWKSILLRNCHRQTADACGLNLNHGCLFAQADGCGLALLLFRFSGSRFLCSRLSFGRGILRLFEDGLCFGSLLHLDFRQRLDGRGLLGSFRLAAGQRTECLLDGGLEMHFLDAEIGFAEGDRGVIAGILADDEDCLCVFGCCKIAQKGHKLEIERVFAGMFQADTFRHDAGSHHLIHDLKGEGIGSAAVEQNCTVFRVDLSDPVQTGRIDIFVVDEKQSHVRECRISLRRSILLYCFGGLPLFLRKELPRLLIIIRCVIPDAEGDSAAADPDFCVAGFTAVFAVKRPRDFLIGDKAQAACTEIQHIFSIDILINIHQGGEDALKLDDIGCLADQHDLKLTIIEAEILEFQHSRDGGSIADHAEQEVILNDFSVILDLHAKRTDRRQEGHAVQQICHVSDDVLDILRRFIDSLRKSTERGNIQKVAVVECSDVAGVGMAVNDILDSVFNVGRDSEGSAEIICRTAGDVSHGNRTLTVHQSLHNFIECTVSAGTYDEIVLSGKAGVFSGGCCVHARLCGPDGDFVSGSGEHIHHSGELVADRTLARLEIRNKIELFHAVQILLLRFRRQRCR